MPVAEGRIVAVNFLDLPNPEAIRRGAEAAGRRLAELRESAIWQAFLGGELYNQTANEKKNGARRD